MVIAGANGVGKSTLATRVVPVIRYKSMSPDEIARELNPKKPEEAAFEAGRIFLRSLKGSLNGHEQLLIETTGSGKFLTRIFDQAIANGYKLTWVHLFLENPEICIERVNLRVKKGGHSVPEEDIIRRFDRSNENFWKLYRPRCDEWYLYYNGALGLRPVAFGESTHHFVENRRLFKMFQPQEDPGDELLSNPAIYQRTAQFSKLGNEAVWDAQAENHRHGLPNPFSLRGRIFYENPDGRVEPKP